VQTQREVPKDLAGLNLELTARNVVTEETVTISVPLPAATFAVIEKTNSQEEEDGFED